MKNKEMKRYIIKLPGWSTVWKENYKVFLSLKKLQEKMKSEPFLYGSDENKEEIEELLTFLGISCDDIGYENMLEVTIKSIPIKREVHIKYEKPKKEIRK